jgi:PKD repeat protein
VKHRLLFPGIVAGVFAILSLSGCPLIQPGVPPAASFRADKTEGTAPLEVAFTDTSDPGSEVITERAWDFGDGGTSDEMHPVHTYREAGSWTVSLIVITKAGTSEYSLPAPIRVNAASVSEGEGEGEGETPHVIINEFVASNDGGLLDEDGEDSDWIELYNPGSAAVNLAGYTLTDAVGDPAKWVFPGVVMDAESHLIVFASDKDRKPLEGGELHANFKLAAGGEYLGLFNSEGVLLSEFRPFFPAQRTNISYGRVPSSGLFDFYLEPTPGAANGAETLLGEVAEVTASVNRGFFEEPFTVTLATETEGAAIYYTLGGSSPLDEGAARTPYTGPVTVESTTVLRATAEKNRYLPAPAETFTWLFPESTEAASLPAICIAGDASSDLYNPDGIMAVSGGEYVGESENDPGVWQAVSDEDYNNMLERGAAYERRISVEFMPPENSATLQADAGIRIHGSDFTRSRYRAGDDWNAPFQKISFRFYFREEYGKARLFAQFFSESPVNSFERLVIRAGPQTRLEYLYADELARRLFRDTGNLTAHGTFANCFINGGYKSYYMLTERIDETFMQDHRESENAWDIISNYEVRDGDTQFWNEIEYYLYEPRIPDDTRYNALKQRIDVTNYIDYIITELFVANPDWLANNFLAAREKADGAVWQFLLWDADAAFDPLFLESNGFYEYPNWEGGAGLNGNSDPVSRLYQIMKPYQEFRTLFNARILEHFSEGGALAPANVRDRFLSIEGKLAGVLTDRVVPVMNAWVPRRQEVLEVQFVEEGLLFGPVRKAGE